MFRAAILRIAVLLAAALSAACGDPANTTGPPAPVAAVDRIVSLNPALTETILALGAGDKLVGLGKYDPPVPGKPDLPRLGDALSVSLEAVVALEPDAVLVNGVGLAERLRPIDGRAPVYLIPTDSLLDVRRAAVQLGEMTGRADAGWRLQGGIAEAVELARVRAMVREKERASPGPRVLVVVQRRPIYTAGAASYLHELLQAVGAQNVAGDLEAAWPTLSEESVLARMPDVILDASVGDSDTAEGRAKLLAGWREHPGIPAVANDRVIVLGKEGEPLFRAGPRVPQALALLERLLYDEERAE